MNAITHRQLAQRKRTIERRLAGPIPSQPDRSVLSATNIRYELAGRAGGIACGGIGLMHLLVQRTGLAEELEASLDLLRVRRPYSEADHVLNLAYNVLAGGTCLEDLEHRRCDVHYLDALGVARLPDPTTAGDFCRRFDAAAIEALQEAVNRVRLRVWQHQPAAFFEEAVIDADGVLAAASPCTEGIGLAYDGTWGYHPLVVSLANTGEPLYLVNRPGNRPSHEGAAERFDQALALVRQAGFQRVLFRGDTDFSQSTELDRWDEQGVRFIFGYDARANLTAIADALPAEAWRPLQRERPAERRARPQNVREQIVRQREYKNHRLEGQQVAEFDYRPYRCAQEYRMVVVRKTIAVERGQRRLFEEPRDFFYITNDRTSGPQRIVELAHQRCDQENLNAQLRHGVRALRMPLDSLLSNWAYMVSTALAWTLKAWAALLLPVSPRWRDRHRAQQQTLLRMEFKTFAQAFLQLPCQIVRTGRRIVYRLLGYNRWQPALLRLAEALSRPRLC